MVNYKLDSMLELRKFIWEDLLNLEIFDENEYYSDNLDGIFVPIIPVQQASEFDQFLNGKKHIVYDKIGLSFEENWAVSCEQILFCIYSTKYSDIIEINNYFSDMFRRMDESAATVNRWNGLSDKFKFHSIHISDISPTSPSEELQGFLSSDVVLEVKYSRITDRFGRFA